MTHNERLEDPISITCANPNCRREIGKTVLLNGTEIFQSGSLLQYEAHGICTYCGHGFHFSAKIEYLKEAYKRKRVQR